MSVVKSTAIKEFKERVACFSEEFKSITYTFLMLEQEDNFTVLRGRIVFEDIPANRTPKNEFEHDMAPCKLLSWSTKFENNIEQLYSELEFVKLTIPGYRKKITSSYKSDSDTSKVPWTFNESIQYREPGYEDLFNASRLYWTRQAKEPLLKQSMIQSLNAKASRHGFPTLEQMVIKYFQNRNYVLNSHPLIEVYAPIWINFDHSHTNFEDGILKATLNVGSSIDLKQLAISYQVLKNINNDDSVISNDSIDFNPNKVISSNRFKRLQVTKKVPQGDGARLLISYKDKMSKDTKVSHTDTRQTKTDRNLKLRPSVVKYPVIIGEPFKEKIFINIKGDYPDKFYYPLEKEINECYKSGHLNATFFLSRKLIENLLYNILEEKFPKNEEIWWSKEFNQPLALSQLIKSLYNNRFCFQSNVKRYIEKVKKLLDSIRNEVNPKAHNIYDYLSSADELDKFKISDAVQLLIKIYSLI